MSQDPEGLEKGIGAAMAGNVPKFDQRHIYTFKNSMKSKCINIKKILPRQITKLKNTKDKEKL